MVPSHSSCPLIVIFVTILLSHPNNQKKKKMFRSATNFMPPPRGRPGWTSASKPKKNWIPLFSYKIEYIIHIKECLINTFSNASSLNEKIVACYAIIADSSYFFPFFSCPLFPFAIRLLVLTVNLILRWIIFQVSMLGDHIIFLLLF